MMAQILQRFLVFFLSVFILSAPLARAQDEATLIADSISINADSTLTADGSVEIFIRGTRLTASRLDYNGPTGTLIIEGPIQLTGPDGTVILASDAQLDSDLRNGIMKGARMVLNSQLQLAAHELRRVDGRYTELGKVVASSCQVCPSHPVPLWEIRARRVIHDTVERQLYFDNASFRVAGVPVLYIPRLRMPDPTLTRATGFLLPTFRSSSELGVGVRIPYFIALGKSRDLTLSPYLSERGQSLFLRYRQAFRTGSLQFDGAVGQDDLVSGTRGYLFGSGNFRLPRDFVLGFQIETTKDDSFLLDYGLTDKDRLASGVTLSRTRRDNYFESRLYHYNSLRVGDSELTLPTLVGDLSLVHRREPGLFGGTATLRFDLHGLSRRSAVPFDVNGDGIADGRDVVRASLGADWRRQDILSNGMVLGLAGSLNADVFAIAEDASFPETITRLTPTVSADLRWPLVRQDRKNGGTQVLEPIAQIVWSREPDEAVPNEDSVLVEFDEGNLFSFSRFPGADLYESGLRANLGVRWSQFLPGGWSYSAVAGRVLRSEDLGQFSTGSRLAGTQSDWLLAVQFSTPGGLFVTNRALFDDKLEFSKNELRLALRREGIDLSSSYVWLVADPAEGRPAATSELSFDAGWHISGNWRGNASGRYDFRDARAARAGVGLQYINECAMVDLSLSRRFTSSTNVRPTTEFAVSVALNGFGTGSNGTQYRRRCNY